ncbi:MAG: glycosyltransferase [Thermoleophilia bacterium]
MRILFSSRPAFGHLYPMLPLAVAARDAGHDVRFATAPAFAARIASLGFPVVGAGISFDEARAIARGAQSGALPPRGGDGRPDIEEGARIFFDVLASRSAADLLPGLRERAPDLVVYEQGEVGAAVAAGVAGVPAVCHAISPRAVVDAVAPLADAHLARLWAVHGLTSPPFDPLLGRVYVDIVPPTLQTPAFLGHPARVALRPVPWAEPRAAVPDGLAGRRRPLIYLTLGTVLGTALGLRPAIEGLARLGGEVVVGLGSAAAAALGDLPPNVEAHGFLDQPAVLRHVDLAVHHGGTGTILGALAQGRRQLLLPKGADQFFNADALAARGMATVLEPALATADRIERAAREALAAPLPAAAGRARDEIAAMPPPERVLDDLLERVGA